jgi:hypothetical protein
MRADSELKNKRGWWLTLYLAYLLVSNFFGIVLSGYAVGANQYSTVASKFLISVTPQSAYGSIFFDIVTIVATILILKWKKVGFYIYCGGVFLRASFLLTLSGFSVISLAVWIFELIVLPGVLYLSMRSRWDLFT